jgi:hypothetical protein
MQPHHIAALVLILGPFLVTLYVGLFLTKR